MAPLCRVPSRTLTTTTRIRSSAALGSPARRWISRLVTSQQLCNNVSQNEEEEKQWYLKCAVDGCMSGGPQEVGLGGAELTLHSGKEVLTQRPRGRSVGLT
ncbi:hypothetical protein E2C01_002898 [Portunus trituberculatus]|uniref:Uncharacterized protein n=1 Tax=Portunus trituberculatus TaxID=210409 RepID=A0A5B7CPE7_PORTR|nr:hypothetical protein [Portunus trituberculatus]